MANYPNLHVLFAQNYAYFFTWFQEEMKTILYHCEQLLIRMSSIWESSCLNQIWQRQNLWISIQYRLKIKLFHLLFNFLLFLNQFDQNSFADNFISASFPFAVMEKNAVKTFNFSSLNVSQTMQLMIIHVLSCSSESRYLDDSSKLWEIKNLLIICHRANIVQAFENYVPYVMDPRYMFSHY